MRGVRTSIAHRALHPRDSSSSCIHYTSDAAAHYPPPPLPTAHARRKLCPRTAGPAPRQPPPAILALCQCGPQVSLAVRTHNPGLVMPSSVANPVVHSVIAAHGFTVVLFADFPPRKDLDLLQLKLNRGEKSTGAKW
ncbi:hypothetical protein FA95DRAFT_1613475 [Auriscalpium vulgare]|uniref:Uncharacterized protein n=1 Tax=Auriscalpium vulgare TaxID=40419 RepID=A0ACB8R2H7_9AGAM|nr:hypothetical protein FA95DRAFT_1613475 [Auriscalpium vulgare]